MKAPNLMQSMMDVNIEDSDDDEEDDDPKTASPNGKKEPIPADSEPKKEK